MDAVYEISTKETTSHPIKITYDDIVEEAIKMIQPKIETIAGEKLTAVGWHLSFWTMTVLCWSH